MTFLKAVFCSTITFFAVFIHSIETVFLCFVYSMTDFAKKKFFLIAIFFYFCHKFHFWKIPKILTTYHLNTADDYTLFSKKISLHREYARYSLKKLILHKYFYEKVP